MSRQREYQLRHLAQGLCIQCSSPAFPGGQRCARCALVFRLSMRARRKGKPWRPGGPGRRPIRLEGREQEDMLGGAR